MPFAGEPVWVISDGKTGHEAQAMGVVEALGAEVIWKPVRPKGLWRALAPWGPVSPSERFGAPGTLFAPPWPKLVIAIGRTTIPYLKALRARAGVGTYSVILLDPKVSATAADLFWVPAHDARRGSNVISSLTAPHRFSAAKLAQLAASLPSEIAALPSPRVALLLGGPNGIYRYGTDEVARISKAAAAIAKSGASLLITSSRRTPLPLVDDVERQTRGAPRVLYRGEGDNPYAFFLAASDVFVVTADSVNMVSEASATGRPIHVIPLDGSSRKFDAFHKGLADLGATRVFHAPFEPRATWSYRPLNSAEMIAREIERRWSNRRAMLAGLVS